MKNEQQTENSNGMNRNGMNRVTTIVKFGIFGVIVYIVVIGLVLYLFKICYLKAGPIPLYASPIVWVGIPCVAFTVYWFLR